MPLGAYTVPVMLVVPVPGQVVCWRQRPVHAAAEPHTLLTPPPPHVAGATHVAPQSMMLPHVSVAMPQVKPCSAQVLGMHVTTAPQTPVMGVAPPPHTWPEGQVPQLIELPQVSPWLPQLKPCI